MAKTGILQLVSSLAAPSIGLLLLITASASAQQPTDAIEAAGGNAMERGYQALAAEDFDEARSAFSDAIATSQGNIEAYIGRARAYAGLELPQNALEDFNQAWTYTSSGDPRMKLLRAKTQYFRGKMYLDFGTQFVGTALPDLQAAYDADRNQLDYAFQLGKAYTLSGNVAQGEPLLSDYLEENPNEVEALRLRGSAYLGLGKIAESLADLEKAIGLDPADHENYLILATLHITEKDYEQAVKALKGGIENYEPEDEEEVDVPFVQGYLTLAAVYEELAKGTDDAEKAQEGYVNCIKTCEDLMKVLPEDQAYNPQRAAAFFRKAISHRLMKEFGKAVKSLTDAIDLNPEMGEAYYRRAICFAEMGENKLALRDLTDSQTILYGDARPYMWEGMVYAQMGEYREAISSYNKAISYSNRYSDAYLNRGHAYFQLGNYESAIDSFNECIRLDPSVAEFYFKRGLCYHNLEQVPEAIQSYVNAIQFDEKYVAAYDLLIPALEAEGRTDMANRYREKRATLGN